MQNWYMDPNWVVVSIFGHRYISDHRIAERALERALCKCVNEGKRLVVLVGCNGEFDQIAAATVKRLKKSYGEDAFRLILVLPYLTERIRENEGSFSGYYDEIELCGEAEKAHYKAAFQKRTREMVDRSDMVICYIEHPEGGAYQTVKYAKKQGKVILNLALMDA